MNSIVKLLPILRLKELTYKDLTVINKLKIVVDSIVFILFILIIYIIFIFPIITEKYEFKNLHLYTLNKNNKIDEYLKKVDNYLKDSTPLYSDKLDINIYVYNSGLLYYLNNPLSLTYTDTFASEFGKDTILFKKVDFNKNLSYSFGLKENFSAILAHEVIHVFQENKYKDNKIPTWVKEGYAMYATRELYTDKPKDILKDFIQNYPNLNSKNISTEYKLWMLMVQHAIEDLHINIDTLHSGQVKYNSILNSLLKKYKLKDKHNDN